MSRHGSSICLKLRRIIDEGFWALLKYGALWGDLWILALGFRFVQAQTRQSCIPCPVLCPESESLGGPGFLIFRLLLSYAPQTQF